MTSWRSAVIWGLALPLCAGTGHLRAQAAKANGKNSCFAIRVRLNGRLANGPETVTYKTKNDEQTAHLEGTCFRVPSALLKEKTIDIFFTLPGNRVYLSSIPAGFFAGLWDVDLEDKRFASDVVLPKYARAKEACAVVFHVGEPETAFATAPCRSPLPTQ